MVLHMLRTEEGPTVVLNEGERKLFGAFMQGKSQKEMAAALGDTPSNIGTRMVGLRGKVGAGGDNHVLAVYGALHIFTDAQRRVWLGEDVIEKFLVAVSGFTERKHELLELLASQPTITSQRIASTWRVDIETVKSHLHQAYGSCGLRGRQSRYKLAVMCKLRADGTLI